MSLLLQLGQRLLITVWITRHYLPTSTAFYATWLVFGDEAVGSEFLDTYPQNRLDGRTPA